MGWLSWVVVLEIALIGVSLSMDAFAVSITDGMCYGNLNKRKGITIPLTFGVFQAGMPLIGFFLGSLFIGYIDAYDHYVAFALLLIIGGKMMLDGIKEAKASADAAKSGEEEEIKIKKFSYPEVLIQGVATSIDALAVGLSMLAMESIDTYNVFFYVGMIGVITFLISLAGLIFGVKIGKLFKNKVFIAEIIGGLVLIGIGLKIMIEGIIG